MTWQVAVVLLSGYVVIAWLLLPFMIAAAERVEIDDGDDEIDARRIAALVAAVLWPLSVVALAAIRLARETRALKP